VQDGLRFYVGAALQDGDGGYATRVMLEQAHMRAVADGRQVPLNAPNQAAQPVRTDNAGAASPAPSASATLAGGEQVALLR
jgi:hypothetical protein